MTNALQWINAVLMTAHGPMYRHGTMLQSTSTDYVWIVTHLIHNYDGCNVHVVYDHIWLGPRALHAS